MLADKFSDVANVAIGALLFGQFLGERGFSLAVALVGIAVWVVLFGLAVLVKGDTS